MSKFDVMLTAVKKGKEADLAKVVKAVTGADDKTAKVMAEGVTSMILMAVDEAKAKDAVSKLNAAGGTATSEKHE